jgi:hypothetical protein
MADANLPNFVEAAIYMVPTGSLSGEYVSSCARGQCGYFGKRLGLSCALKKTNADRPRIVLLERLYDKIGVPTKRYPRRSKSIPRSNQIY